MKPNGGDGELVYRTLDGDEAVLARTKLDAFRGSVRGAVLTAAEAGFEEACRLWNCMVEKRPAVVVRCLSSRDVQNAVAFARAHDILVSVRGGGHHIAGNAIADGGLMIDLSPMRSVRVDAARRVVRAGGGALLGDVDHETQAFGLATPTGINSTTGLAGLCLGGGFGWLTRPYGLTADNLLSADVVTADGNIRLASEAEDPDLFWAIRGGGGNFGVVTSFELRLHAVGPMVHAGVVVYPGAEARGVLRRWRDVVAVAPDELTAWAVMRKAPPLPFLPVDVHGTDAVVIAALWAGPLEAGPQATAPLLALGHPHGHMLGPQPFEAWQQTFDPMLTPGARNYWKSHDFEEVTDDAIDVFVEGLGALPGPECEVFLGSLGGAMGRVPRDATAFASRDARVVMNVHGRWRRPEDDGLVRSWARGVFDRAAPFATGGGYVNFFTDDEGPRVASAYGSNFERLREIKRRVDPGNLFRVNHNIPPEAAGASRRKAAGRTARPAG